MFRDAALVAGKDLRIEWRSHVTTNQVAPFAVLVLILFAFALDPDRDVLQSSDRGSVLDRDPVLCRARRAAGLRPRGGRRQP